MTAAAGRGVAVVTGASRGIGRACALGLAEAGFDIVVVARSLDDRDSREHSPSIARSDTRPIPGSGLTLTADGVRQRGRTAWTITADLGVRDDVARVVERASGLEQPVEVLVNCARFVGPGHFDRFVDTPLEYFWRTLEVDCVAGLALCHGLLPQMVERGSGRVINLTSTVAYGRPTRPAGAGGAGVAYAAAKGAFHRIAPHLALELPAGVSVFNVDPGYVVVERTVMEAHQFGFDLAAGGHPDTIAHVVSWLATSPAAVALSGECIDAQRFAQRIGVVAPGPRN